MTLKEISAFLKDAGISEEEFCHTLQIPSIEVNECFYDLFYIYLDIRSKQNVINA